MRGILGAVEEIPAGSGAVVMGTGIVSTALLLDRSIVLSRILLVLTAVVWIALAVVVSMRLIGERERFLAEARSPAGLTGVAGTAVLGTRLTELGWTATGVALLAVSFLGWALLMPMVLRRLRHEHRGSVFLITVATEGLATLSAVLAPITNRRWLLDMAIVMAAIGIVLYPLALRRFDLRELRRGRGDQWVAGGSLAISALALALCADAAARLGTSGSARSVLEGCALAAWAAGIVWVAPLVLTELRRERPRYDTRRWATVFPVGMYAACSFAVAEADRIGGLHAFASAWVWTALAVWLLVCAGMVGALRATLRQPAPVDLAAERQGKSHAQHEDRNEAHLA